MIRNHILDEVFRYDVLKRLILAILVGAWIWISVPWTSYGTVTSKSGGDSHGSESARKHGH